MALVALFVVVVFMTARSPDDLAIAECRASYAKAQSLRDTTTVDRLRPITSRGQATVAVTCQVFRLSGRLGQN
jgi:hypothetical protein